MSEFPLTMPFNFTLSMSTADKPKRKPNKSVYSKVSKWGNLKSALTEHKNYPTHRNKTCICFKYDTFLLCFKKKSYTKNDTDHLQDI